GEVDRDTRMLRQEFRQKRRHMQPPEQAWRAETQSARRRRSGLPQGALGLLDLAQNTLGAIIEVAPRFGEPEAARRPMEQSPAEPRLERGELAAHRGEGTPEPAGSGRKAAR